MSSSAPVSACTSAGSGTARAAACSASAVEDVVRDPVALVLARDDLAADAVGLGVVGEQVAQQQRRALHVAPGLLEELEQRGSVGACAASRPR